ncbi:MAG: glutaminase A [Candidatus Sericytochromatia bacterium]|nr:glutaminase A [Candidatus Sericytochromatia bacterium]
MTIGFAQLEALLRQVHAVAVGDASGEVATYIPELAKADPEAFGVAFCTVEGQVGTAGDAGTAFTIQSVSKPFLFGMALDAHGRQAVGQRVGVEPTGDPFNAIITLEQHTKRPHNPMVNAGAIAVASMVPGLAPADRLNHLLEGLGRYAGRRLHVDTSVYLSERATGHRNRAMAHLMLNFGMLDGAVEEVLDLYFQQCSVLVTARDLAVMAAVLANRGVHPLTGERALGEGHVRDVLSVMFSCGMYDASGRWMHEVGLPAKSGVGGGILAVVPGRMGLAAFSPRLDPHGHSVRGMAAIRELARALGLHVFGGEYVRS